MAFCGHATIAAGVALGKETGGGTYPFDTTIGRVPVVVGQQQGELRTSLTAVEPKFELASASLLARALSALRWSDAKLDPCIAPARAFGGNWDLVIAVASKSRLDDLDYDFEALKTLMLDDNLTTLQLIWRASDQWIHSRNPFPIEGWSKTRLPAPQRRHSSFGYRSGFAKPCRQYL